MNRPDDTDPRPDRPRPVSKELATHLLHIGMDEDTPVDHLVTRITLADGPKWFEGALAAPLIGDGERVRAGGCSLDELADLKDRAKRQLGHAATTTEEAIAILGYLLAQAGSLVHHGQSLSEKTPEELPGAFADLAAVAPGPWSEFFARARDLLDPQ